MTSPTPAELMAEARKMVAEYRVGRAAAAAKRAAECSAECAASLAVIVAADAVAKRHSPAWWAARNEAWE
ncbi:MAG: hypothetical protein ACRD2H_07330 [Terriglobales bacterium]